MRSSLAASLEAESGKSVGAGGGTVSKSSTFKRSPSEYSSESSMECSWEATGSFIDLLEELSTVLHILRGPDLPINVDSTQCLGLCVFESTLFIPNPTLLLRRAAQKVWVIDRVCLGAFDVGVRVIGPALLGEQPCQGVMYPKQAIVPAEG